MRHADFRGSISIGGATRKRDLPGRFVTGMVNELRPVGAEHVFKLILENPVIGEYPVPSPAENEVSITIVRQ